MKERLFNRALAAFMVMLLFSCSSCASDSEKSVSDPSQEANSPSQEATPESAEMPQTQQERIRDTYEEFTVDALERYAQDYSFGPYPPMVEDIRPLGSAIFDGDGVIDIPQIESETNSYYVEYMCSQPRSSAFSISLVRESERHRMIKVGGCPGGGIYATSLPVKLFPQAQSVRFEGEDNTSFVAVVHEVKEREQ